MKNFKFLGIIALVAVMMVLAGCATNSSLGGTADAHGLISSAKIAAEGATEIASYNVILGLITSGYEEYAAAVNAAIASGKTISSVTTWKMFLVTTTAYAK